MVGEREKRIVMTRDVATRWILRTARPEHRLRVFHRAGDHRNLSAMLRSLRDGKTVMSGVAPVRDFGIREDFDGVEVWSSNQTALVQMQEWFEKRGFETTGVW